MKIMTYKILLTITSTFTGILFLSCNKSHEIAEAYHHSIKNIESVFHVDEILKKKKLFKSGRFKKLGTLKALNSGTDSEHLELGWDTYSIKGISGYFDVFRKLGNSNYELIFISNGYDGLSSTNEFLWQAKNNQHLGSYTHDKYLNQSSIPFRNTKYRVVFRPSYSPEKNRNLAISNEISANLIPKNTDMTLQDIIENIKYAHKPDCGLFKTVLYEDFKQPIIRNGAHTGKYERYIDELGNITYKFESYANHDSIMINGILQTKSVHFKSRSAQTYLIPRKINGDLNISGLYEATLSFNNLDFSDLCGKNIENGMIKLIYKHPRMGILQKRFMGLEIPQSLLSFQYDEEYSADPL